MIWNSPFLLRPFIILTTFVLFGKGVILDCYRTTPSQYDGHQQTTVSGEACVRWDVKGDYSDGVFPDSTVSDAANYCRSLGSNYLWCFTSTIGYWNRCGIGKCADDSLTQCGQLTIEKPTILGRNVTFTFTADTNNSNAIVEWQRKNGENSWQTLPFKYNFMQYSQDWTYNLILTDTVRNDEVLYRVHYYNESMHCLMETPKLTLKDISSYPCGFIRLRMEKVKENETVEIEYYPSKHVTDNPESFVKQWMLYKNQKTIPIEMKTNVYEEKMEPNDKYVLTISRIHENIAGRYGVYCDKTERSSNNVKVEILVAPSAPVFPDLQDIEDSKGCIVGEDGDQFSVVCKTSGGTEPVTISMSIGQYSLHTIQYNNPGTYITFFDLFNSHHMLLMACSVINEALMSPLTTVARVYVIKSPTLQSFTVPETLKEGDEVNITCIFRGGRPAPNVFLNIAGTEVSSTDQTSDLNSTNIAHLTTFKRIWNKENITCCRYNKWYHNVNECSPTKQVNYLFPPSDIKLEIKVEEELPHQVYAVCAVYDSNPVCEVNLSAPAGMIVSERYKNKVSRPYGGWDTELAVNLNVSKDDNGIEIECSADCPDFIVGMKDKKSIIVPHGQRFNDKDEKPIIWIILTSCSAAVLIVVIIACLVRRHKRRKAGANSKAYEVSFSATRNGDSETIENLEDRSHEQLQGATYEQVQGAAYEQVQGAAYEQLQDAAYEQLQGATYERLQGAAYEQLQGTAYEQLQGTVYEQLQGSEYENAQSEDTYSQLTA